MGTPDTHNWKFFRSGGFDQVKIDSADDLRNLRSLDQKLWAILTCPIAGLELDARTLELIDTDHEGRVRVPEILAAVDWTCRVLRDPGIVFDGNDGVTVEAIAADDPPGAQLIATALQVLAQLGRDAGEPLRVADLQDRSKLFPPGQPNGDGIVPSALAGDEILVAAIEAVIRCKGSKTDRSGDAGIDQAALESFFDDAKAVCDWHALADEGGDSLRPLGEGTASAVAVFDAVRVKVEDFFTRCRLAAFDPLATTALNPAAEAYGGLSPRTLSASDEAVGALPLARVEPGALLPLRTGLNPAWEAAIQALREQVVKPLLGQRESLSQAEWQALASRFDAWRAWQGSRPVTNVADEPLSLLRSLLQADARAKLLALIEKDRAANTASGRLDELERLLRYRRDLATLLRNFVNLSDFYSGKTRAIFQAGTLYIDRRSCELCLRVDKLDRHVAMAPLSATYLLYCECVREGESPITIAAALTGGDVDEMMVAGRHGVFYDRQGRDWHARVIKVVEAPVSVRQAFWSPYKRIARLAGEQIRKFAMARDKNVEAKASAGLTGAMEKAEAAPAATAARAGQPAAAGASAAPAPAAQPVDMARYAGIFAAVGLAVGALGTAVAAIVGTLASLPLWEIPLVIAGLMLVISGPSMFLAWLKLRRRNLGPLLDANGWAVNTRARINLPFGASLTGVAALPPGSSRSLIDPFADKPVPWGRWALALAVLIALVAWGVWRYVIAA